VEEVTRMADELKGVQVAVLATDGVEEAELTEPVGALKQAGAKVRVLSLDGAPIQMFEHHDKSGTFDADGVIGEERPEDFEALVLPGGALNADRLRTEKPVIEFVKSFDAADKPMAVICHAPWELISAGVAAGRSLTSYHTIKDDLVNAGAHWQDSEVVEDGNLVTSRKPDDLPAFNRAMIGLIAKRVGART
jgi:protease I